MCICSKIIKGGTFAMNPNFGSIHYFNCKDLPSNYKCKYCDFTTDLWVTLNYHIWRRHKSFHDYSKIDSKIEMYTCEHCTFTSCSILVWHRHERTCTYASTSLLMVSFHIDGENFFCCKLCEYKSMDCNDFQLHILQPHTEQKSFKRDKCEYKARMQRGLKAYVRRRRDSRNLIHYYCSQCSCNSLSKTNLENHIIARHTDPKEINWFKCNQCEYKAKTKYCLNQHLKRKHEDLYNECKQCSYGTTIKADLKAHIISRHTDANDIKWFKCDKCKFKAKLKRHLTQHIKKVHKNTDVFKCSHCSYETAFKYSLKSHVIARHTDPKEIKWFECDRCDYKAKAKGSLKGHINRNHVRENRVYYECSHCSYRAVYKNQLKSHVNARHRNSN